MHRLIMFCGLLTTFMLLPGNLATRSAQAETYVVTTNADSGRGSLRNAIGYANQHPATTITFKIPSPLQEKGVAAIRVKTPLPSITADSTTIDGATQPIADDSPAEDVSSAHPRVVLKGTLLGTDKPFNGLIITAAHCLVNKIVVNDFSGTGIRLRGAATQGNRITGCYLGLSAQGGKPFPNNFGLGIDQGASANVIGGLNASDRNVISGNNNNGLNVSDTKTANNVIEGNYIGTDPSGQIALANGINGIEIDDGAERTTVGGTQAGARNVISGNGWAGILIYEAHDNVASGNYIGTDSSGSKPIGNNQCGINITGRNNIIGGTTPEARNVIAGNTQAGIALRDPSTEHNLITGNYLGTDESGTRQLGNDEGLSILAGAQNNTVGGTTPDARNIISGNKNYGVTIHDDGTSHNTVVGNFIGTDIAGTAALSNDVGIVIHQAASNLIGGTGAGSGNLISGNKNIGIKIEKSKTHNNQVQGNTIGLDISGTKPLSNGGGVVIQDGAQSNLIGGSTPAARNVIAGNSYTGVEIFGSGTSHNTVAGNFIGTDASGKVGVGNGTADINVYIYDEASSNMIGGTEKGAGNIIAFNYYGVAVKQPQTNGNAIRGNSIRAINPANKHLGITLYATPIDNHGLLALRQPGSAVGPNHLLNYPIIEDAKLTTAGVTITGVILATPGKHYTLDFFASLVTEPLKYGEGQVYLGSSDVTMTGANNTKFTCSLVGDTRNKSFTATLTDSETGDTSEFSPPKVPQP